MSVIDQIKDRVDIAEVIGESVKLRKSGKNFMGFCPFHSNTRTPAFAVFVDSGTWRCFGACNEGGDVFSFLMKKEGWDFSETLRYLAERTGVELAPRTARDEAEEEAHERLRSLLEAAVFFYRHNLLDTEAGRDIEQYLIGRGLTQGTLERFEIGYAPEGWEPTLTYLKEKGFSEQEMLEAGMVTERDSGGVYDRFRKRIMIPIRDARGRMSGFGARITDPQDVPKFLNSPQTALFDKGRSLYGLDKARKAIRLHDQAVIVEGYMDVIALHQAGFENAVSPMGTAISESQLRMLKRYSRRMLLALDADAAGSQATLRGLTVAREALDRELDPIFDARGLIRHEGRLDAELRVLSLPDGLDPDEVVVQDPETWLNLVQRAQTVVDYVIEILTANQDLDDPKVKAEIARQVLPLIEDVADPVEREAYRQNLARQLKVDERALMNWRPRAPSRRRRQPAGTGEESQDSGRAERESPLERFCLGVLLYNPELLYRVDRHLQSLDLERISAKDFSNAAGEMIFDALRKALSQDDIEPSEYWRSSMEAPLIEKAESLLSEVVDYDLTQVKVLDEIRTNFLRLRKRNLETKLTQLRFQMQAAQEADVPEEERKGDVWYYTREVQQIAAQKERLDRAMAHPGGTSDAVQLAQGR